MPDKRTVSKPPCFGKEYGRRPECCEAPDSLQCRFNWLCVEAYAQETRAAVTETQADKELQVEGIDLLRRAMVELKETLVSHKEELGELRTTVGNLQELVQRLYNHLRHVNS